MLNFIKKLFQQKEKIGLTLDKLDEWFKQKTKSHHDNINTKISEIKQKILQEVSKTKENINNLENAELRNDKITTKEIQFMEGNRSFYLKRINFFLDSIKIPEDYLKSFTERMDTEIEALGKSTAKAYQILQHFFNDETYKIAQNIKNLDTYFKQLKELTSDKKTKSIDEIKEKIRLLKENITKEKHLTKEIDTTEDKITKLGKEKKSILSEISHKEQSPEYKEYHRLKVDEYKVQEQIDEIKDEILHLFSVLEHPLRKHIKLHPEDEEFLKKYIQDPLKALVDDYELKIKKILEKVEENIHTKKIELKDKKKERTLQVLNKINEAKLASFLTDYNNLMVQLRGLSERLDKHSIIDEIEDIKISLKNKKQEIEDLNKKLSETKESIAKINIIEIKNKIKEKISELLDVDLEID